MTQRRRGSRGAEVNAKVAKGTKDAKDENHILHRLTQIFLC